MLIGRRALNRGGGGGAHYSPVARVYTILPVLIML